MRVGKSRTRTSRFFGLVFLGFVLGWSSAALARSETFNTAWYQVSARDAASREMLLQRINHFEAWIPSYFSAPTRFEPKVEFRLEAEAGESVPSRPFQILRTGPETVEVAFFLDPGGAPEWIHLALVQSFLVRRQLWRGESGQMDQVPKGIFLALAAAITEAEIPYRYARNQTEGWPVFRSWDELGNQDFPDQDNFFHAFYHWEFWRALSPRSKLVQEWLDASTTDSWTTEAWLTRAGYPVPEEAGLELLWRTWLASRWDRQSGPVQSVQETRQIFFDLLQVTLVVDSRSLQASVVDLWDQRRTPWVGPFCRQRFERVKRILPEANPVYFNALHSLGQVLEALENQQLSAFESGVEQLAEDLDAAEALYQSLRQKGY